MNGLKISDTMDNRLRSLKTQQLNLQVNCVAQSELILFLVLVLQHLAVEHPKLFGVVAVAPNEDKDRNRSDIEVVKMVYKQQIVTVNIHR